MSQTTLPTNGEPPVRDRRIIPINAQVRTLLGLYLNLFRNYEEAAQAAGVSKDTIAKYFEGNPNIAYYVFERILAVLGRRLPAESVREAIPGSKPEDLLALAHDRNGQQIDNVMYEITGPVLRLLQFYTAQFPSRARAAQRLEVNPRTFKAYLKQDIRSFPRRKFERMASVLAEKGFSQSQLQAVAGIGAWEELLSAKVRMETWNINENELLSEITKLFEAGTLKNNLIEKRLRNAANRIYGSLGNAVRAAMKEIETASIARIETAVEKANFAEAFKEIRRFENYVQIYAAKERAITRSAGPARKRRWREEVLSMSQRKNKLKKLVFQALRLADTDAPDGEAAGAADPADYTPERQYRAGEILLHPEFGLGHVLKTLEDRQCVVTFGPKVGEKTLIMNQRRGGPEFWTRS